MSFKCSVFLCDSKSDKRTKNAVSFFEFPSTPTRKQNWLESIGRPSFKPLRSSRVCSNHFEEKSFIRSESQVVLKSDAVPIILNAANKSTPRLTVNSSRSSEENILLNGNKRVQITTSTSEVQQMGIKRPRRNTVYLGSYKLSRTNRVATSPSQTTPNDLSFRPPVTRDAQRTDRVSKETQKTNSAKNQSSIDNQITKEVETIIQRLRSPAVVGPKDVGIRTSVTRDAQRTNRVSQGPLKKTPNVARNQSKHFRIRTPVANRKSNRLSIEPTPPPPSRLVIRRQRDGAFNGMAKTTEATNQVSKVTRKFAPTPSTNQSIIDKYFPKKNTSASKVVTVEPEHSTLEDCIFGWSEMGPHAVPFILRNSEKFCALRVFEKSVLVAYKKRKPIIGPCDSNIECFLPTRAECELLNEINVRHCDSAFGKERFSMKDKLVRLKDADKYFTFVDICHESIMKRERVQSEGLKFGFTSINGKSYIPHIIQNERKFIPLSYFHCDSYTFDILDVKAQKLSGGDALFLKFCCKFDGIPDVDDCIDIIELRELRLLAPPDTTFENCWPTVFGNYRLQVMVTVEGLRFECVKRNYQFK